MDIEYIRNEIKLRGYMRFEEFLLRRVDELEEGIHKFHQECVRQIQRVEKAENRIKELEGAIKKNEAYKRSHYQIVSLEDEELYKVLHK